MAEHLSVAPVLQHFVETEALPGTGLEAAAFWTGLAQIIATFAPRNAALLARRDSLQAEIDAWHRAIKGQRFDAAEYRAFLTSIGYLLPSPGPFSVETSNVDAEITSIAGPQLVVPVSNARYALNAGNARWGSLYDALYGTDAIDETGAFAKGSGFNAVRGAEVVRRAKEFLDSAAPLRRSWSATPGMPPRPPPLCSAITACTSSCASTAPTISGPPIRPASPTSSSNRRSRRSWISRTAWRPSMPRTRSSCIATGSA
jgi:malate synthase